MAKRTARPSALERELAALDGIDPTRDLDALRAALASPHALVVERAAQAIRRAELDTLGPDLSSAFDRVLALGAAGDRGCRAKLAILEALDATSWPEREPFLAATRVVQLEPAIPQAADTAGGVRSRGVLALARLGDRDLPLVAGALLWDAETATRLAAADALGAHGSRDAASALASRLAAGDEEPNVEIACLSALLAVAPDHALDLARRGAGARPIDREVASIALGSSRREDALALLLEWLRDALTTAERAPLIHAVALHRSERAVAALLEILAEGADADALEAAAALRARRFDPGLPDRARAAAEHRSDAIRRALDRALH